MHHGLDFIVGFSSLPVVLLPQLVNLYAFKPVAVSTVDYVWHVLVDLLVQTANTPIIHVARATLAAKGLQHLHLRRLNPFESGLELSRREFRRVARR